MNEKFVWLSQYEHHPINGDKRFFFSLPHIISCLCNIYYQNGYKGWLDYRAIKLMVWSPNSFRAAIFSLKNVYVYIV